MTKDGTSSVRPSITDQPSSGRKKLSLEQLESVTGVGPSMSCCRWMGPPELPPQGDPADGSIDPTEKLDGPTPPGGEDNDPGLGLSTDGENSFDPNQSIYEEESDA